MYVLAAVQRDDALCFTGININLDPTHTKGEGVAELRCTHTEAEAEDAGLTNEAF